MDKNSVCQRCGADLTGQAVDGHCANCLLALALEPLQQEISPAALPPAMDKAEDEFLGAMVGRYKLLDKLGEGGCGVVYVAEQSEPIRRRVALKVIKLGMDTKQVISRFGAERQALAMMDHPNIARVLDAGATEAGRPYFVMELVRGIRITDYCDQHHLSTEKRLNLFVKVAQAIQHAHQKGIIHRDIKPSNILVTLHDGVPVPKVIDFGIAKATEGRLTDATVYTQLHQFIGTPAYMSPEQAEMSGLDIDTRTDIYSLGVLLYELLVGTTPFDAKELLASGIDAIRRTIRENEPQRPSTRLTSLNGDELTTIARRRSTEGFVLLKLIEGDLDWIVMKCLEKDRTRRYETANGLAADIKRHLDNEPVAARPPSSTYRFQKLVRRNMLAFAAGAGVCAALLLGIVASTLQALRATRAEQEQSRLRIQAENNEKKAEAEAAKSQKVAEFMQGMLKAVGPSFALGRDTTMLREILDQTAGRLGELKEQPAVEADLRATLGNVYADIALYTNAATMHREALALRKMLFGAEHADVASSLNDLAGVLLKQGRHSEAEAMYGKAAAMRRNVLGNDHPTVAETLNHLSIFLRDAGRLKEAEVTAREVIAIRKHRFGNEDPSVAAALQSLSWIVNRFGRHAEAEVIARESVAIYKKVRGNVHPDVLFTLIDVATALFDQGRLAESAAATQEMLQIVPEVLREESPYVGQVLHQFAWLLHHQRRFAESETMARQTLELRRKLFGNEHPDVGQTLHWLGFYLRDQNKFEESESIAREALAIHRKLFGQEHEAIAQSMHQLAWNISLLGKNSEAEALSRQEVQMWRNLYGDGHGNVAWALGDLSVFLRNQGRLDEGVTTLREALVIRRKTLDNDHPEVVNLISTLGRLLQSQGKLTEAESLLREELVLARSAKTNSTLGLLLHHLADIRRVQNEHGEARGLAFEALALYEAHPNWPEHERYHAFHVLTAILNDLGDFAALEPLYRKNLESFRARHPADHPNLAVLAATLTETLLAQNKFSEAEPLAREALAIREEKSPDDWRTFNSRSALGGSLLGQKRFAEAEPFLLSGYDGLQQRERRIPPVARPRLKESLHRIVKLYEATGQTDRAAEWSDKLASFKPDP